jgi:hypothetical protein
MTTGTSRRWWASRNVTGAGWLERGGMDSEIASPPGDRHPAVTGVGRDGQAVQLPDRPDCLRRWECLALR